jgi:cytoskeletal protein RodZ
VEDSLLLKMFVLYVAKAPQSQATSSANSKQVQDAVLVGDDELSGASSEHSDYPNDDSDADSEKEEIDEDLEAPSDAGSNLDAPLTSMAKTVVKGPRNSQRAVSKKAAKAPTQKGMTWKAAALPKKGTTAGNLAHNGAGMEEVMKHQLESPQHDVDTAG